MKKIIYFLLLIIFTSSVLADIIPPTKEQIAKEFSILVLIFLINYIINFLAVLVQSKIWLDLKIKKILIGILIATPILFIVEAIILGGGYRFNDNIKIFLYGFISILVVYFLICKLYWKIEYKETIITSLLMALITNPLWGTLILRQFI